MVSTCKQTNKLLPLLYIKELNDELEKKSAVLERMNEKFETVTTRREREGHEEDNLIRILREDLDRINDER